MEKELDTIRIRKNKILKPLVNINGKTILERIIEIYYRNGISEFVLLGGYKINNLKNFVKKKLKNYNITVLNTGLNTETGGRLLFAKKIISDDTFLFTYGDSIADFNLSRAIIMKKDNFIMSFYEYNFQYGVLEYMDRKLKNINEKNYFIPINAGFYILDGNIFNFIKVKKIVLKKKFFQKLLILNIK